MKRALVQTEFERQLAARYAQGAAPAATMPNDLCRQIRRAYEQSAAFKGNAQPQREPGADDQ